jgi:hypothetical protein
MITFYECEICNQRYADDQSAIACEQRHAEAALRRKELEEKKAARAREICDIATNYESKLAAYYGDYKTFPRQLDVSMPPVLDFLTW